MSMRIDRVKGAMAIAAGLTVSAVNAETPVQSWSPTEPFPEQSVYFPGTEALQVDEMRVVACGTGMPQPRLKQAGSCFLVELGNGDKFIFDLGKGASERLAALGIPTDQLNKVFLSHLHFDHAGDFPSFWLARGVNAARQPLFLWGPGGGQNPEWGVKGWSEYIKQAWSWDVATRESSGDPRSTELTVTEFDWWGQSVNLRRERRTDLFDPNYPY